MKHFSFLFILLGWLAGCSSGNKAEVASPDGSLKATFRLDDRGGMSYMLLRNGDTIIDDSKLGFILKDRDTLADGFTIEKIDRYKGDSKWTQVWGENREVTDRHNGAIVHLKKADGRRLDVEFRVFDDGIGFRYLFPEQPGLAYFVIMDELTGFNLANESEAWWTDVDLKGFYERKFLHTPVEEITWATTPLTLRQTKDSLHLTIHEAALYDYSDMTLRHTEGKGMKAELVPWSDGDKVKASTPFQTPWRTVIVTPTAGEMLMSNLMLNLNEPNRIEDVSWIRPMTYIGIWWNMHLGLETTIYGDRKPHAATTDKAIAYLEFAKANNIGGMLVEGWNTGWEKLGEHGVFDFVTPTPDYDLKKVAAKAKELGVDLIMHHETGSDVAGYEKYMDTAYMLCEELGIRAIKSGYAGNKMVEYHQSQPMVRHYQKAVEEAAKYGIMLDIHEPIKGTGTWRTWPNMMTREGVRGQEWEAWSSGNSASHTTTIPFVRGLAGPADYTPGVFDIFYAKSRKGREKYIKDRAYLDMTRVHTTLAHQLALMITIYSPLVMANDLPSNYQGHPAFQFVRDLDPNYDESKVLDASVGEYLVTARRTGDSWYIGATTDETGRELTAPLSFLEPDATYEAIVYRDGADADWETNPESYAIDTLQVDSTSKLALKLAPGGGAAVTLKKK